MIREQELETGRGPLRAEQAAAHVDAGRHVVSTSPVHETVATAQGDVTLPQMPQSVAVFDMAALDSLLALGIQPAGTIENVTVPALRAQVEHGVRERANLHAEQLGHHGHEPDVATRRQEPGMDRAQMSASHHRHAGRRHAALRLGRERPCRPSCWFERNPSTVSTSGT